MAKSPEWVQGPRSLVTRGLVSAPSLSVRSCELRSLALTPLPGQGLSVSVTDSLFSVQGKWKIRVAFT